MESDVAVALRGITKIFGKTVANHKVSLDIKRGEVLAILGENGSGKTTLMNALAGIYAPDEGHIYINGEEVEITSPRIAFSYGIGMIHQHFKLVDVLTAAENIILGLKEPGGMNLKKVGLRVEEICEAYGFDLNPQKKVYDMSVSEKQTLEIVKVLYRGADILILDEPTAVLTPQETNKLFAVLKNMREDGKAIVIITHKLHEVMEISDRVAVLRKGEYIGEIQTSKTNPQELTNMMVGRAVSLNIDRPEPQNRELRIEVKNLNVVSEDGIQKLKDVSFQAFSGEILGIAGISGSGQKELLEAIAGLQKASSGEILFINDDGTSENLIGRNPVAIAQKGITLSFVPEDRLGMGLVGNMDLSDNMMLRSYRKGSGPFTDRKSPHALAERVVEELSVMTPSIETPVRRLSGGNVQKVLVGREISLSPRVLLTAYAVRGLDINSSYTIYDLLNRQKALGVAVIYVGEDLDVLLELCDRILVLCAGHVTGVVDGRSITKEEVGLLMTQHGKEEAADE
ncbi:MAG: ABC transporter ATP-binding protein [Clostridia bacterium]|nr:ABC transporter ATP-binding protein [Clostridia bacterium]